MRKNENMVEWRLKFPSLEVHEKILDIQRFFKFLCSKSTQSFIVSNFELKLSKFSLNTIKTSYDFSKFSSKLHSSSVFSDIQTHNRMQ